MVVGAGIAGVAIAHRLATGHGLDVALVDPLPPLSLTSDKSTECYRNWWPSRPMVGLMNQSIDILEHMARESANRFRLTRRGYLFVTARPEQIAAWHSQAGEISAHGGGAVRSHDRPQGYVPAAAEGFESEPDGVDILTGPGVVSATFPYLTARAAGALHVRRAGWFSAQQLGALMLETAAEAGLARVIDRVAAIDVAAGRVRGVRLASGEAIQAPIVIDAAGPLADEVAAMVGLSLPLRSEVHLKVAFRDHLEVVPRDAPMVIWSDPQHLDWDAEERAGLADAGRVDLLDEMPRYCHGRPEGGSDSPYFLALWEYHGVVRRPTWPIPDDDMYPEVVARGLATMVPGFSRYRESLPSSRVDGGYYTKTPENLPLLGPAGPDGFHLACGYSGFGVMVAAGAADLVARHVVRAALPGHADAFLLARYDQPGYLASISGALETGQL